MQNLYPAVKFIITLHSTELKSISYCIHGSINNLRANEQCDERLYLSRPTEKLIRE